MSTYATQTFGGRSVDMGNDVAGRAVGAKRVECVGMQIFDVFQERGADGEPVKIQTSDYDQRAPHRLDGTDDMVASCALETHVRGEYPTVGQKLHLEAQHFFDTEDEAVRAKLEGLNADSRVAEILRTTAAPRPAAALQQPPTLLQLLETTAEQRSAFRPAGDAMEGKAVFTKALSINGYEAEKDLCEAIKRVNGRGDASAAAACTAEEVSVTGAMWNASRIFHQTQYLQHLADKGADGFTHWVTEAGQDKALGDTDEALRTALQRDYGSLAGGARLLPRDDTKDDLIQQHDLREKMACAMAFTVKNAARSAPRSAVGDEVARAAAHVSRVACAGQLGGVLV